MNTLNKLKASMKMTVRDLYEVRANDLDSEEDYTVHYAQLGMHYYRLKNYHTLGALITDIENGYWENCGIDTGYLEAILQLNW